MSVNRFTSSVSRVITQQTAEVAAEEAAPQASSTVPVTGIASFSDGMEATTAQFFSYLDQTTTPSLGDQALTPAPTLDAADLFDYVAGTEEPKPPVDPEPTAPGLGQKLAELTEKKIVDTYKKQMTKEYGPDPHYETQYSSESYNGGVKMPNDITSLGDGGGTTIGSLEGSWNAAEIGKVDETTEGEYGSAYFKGSTKIIALDGKLYYNLGIDPDKKTIGAGVGAQGSLEVVGAHYEAGYKTPGITIGDDTNLDINSKVNADAYVGVKGDAEVGITLGKENTIKGGAGGFAGASSSLGGEIGAGEMADVHGEIKGWAGIGVKAEFEAGYKDGKFTFDTGLGLALGPGLEWDAGISVDFGEIVEGALDGMREIGLEDEADWVEDTGQDVIDQLGDVVEQIGGIFEDVIGGAGEAAEDTGDVIEDGWNTVTETAEDVVDAVVDVGSSFVDLFDEWP